MQQQTPTDKSRTVSRQRAEALRREMDRRQLDGFIVPRADEHQGEYVAASAQRLAWLTGFTGSAGVAVVLKDRAALFVDGRYTLQAAAQIDASLFETLHLIDQPPHQWLGDTLPAGARFGYDPWLHTPFDVERLGAACSKAGATLIACPDNPLDAAWTDRPAPPTEPVVPHPLAFAGRGHAEKRADIARTLAGDGIDAAVLSAPDSIAWLLNLRGGDVDFAPMPLSFAIVHADDSVDLFIDRRKLTDDVAEHLGARVRIAEPGELGPALDRLEGRRVRLDPSSAPSWVEDRLIAANALPSRGADPCLLPRACKNGVELAGTRNAHLRDGVAMVRFLAWLAEAAPAGTLTEIAAAERLENFRRDGEYFRQPSFPTISAAGPHGAIVHYRPHPDTNRVLEPGEIYLLDSGGQYLDATTDITRTMVVPGASHAVTARQRRLFTLVLKGHIAIATCRFPVGTSGGQIDCLARRALWAEGLDYDHGTGHGVGSYLSVHEGPQRIAKTANSSHPLMPGMIVSNEPGYYETGAFGIRIENLVAVRPWDGGGRPMLEFETLTLAPFDRGLIDRELLDPGEIAWIDAYHNRVRDMLTPHLDPVSAAWLASAAAAI